MPTPHQLDDFAAALIGLIGALDNPRQDDVLLREADVTLDRALFPLVTRLGAIGPVGVVELANQAGRDHTTISRQLTVLEQQGLVRRRTGAEDKRVREVLLTAAGNRIAKRLADARRRLFGKLLSGWNAADCEAFTRLARKMSEDVQRARDALVEHSVAD